MRAVLERTVAAPAATAPAGREEAGPALLPLTHHEIMARIAPFSAAGWRIDLAGSARAERQLRFTRGGAERLLVDLADAQVVEITRVLTDDAPPALEQPADEAFVVARAGTEAAALERVESVPRERCFSTAAGVRVAYDHRIEVPERQAPPRCRLTAARARPGGWPFALQLPLAGRMTGELMLHAPAGQRALLPQDLLAVLGYAFSRLEPWRGGHRAALRVQGREPGRSEAARRHFEQAVQHLVATLDAPPAAFGERWARARWRVTLRRAVPLAVCLALFGGAISLPWIGLDSDSVLRMLVFNAPPLLLVWMFALREMPRIEVPPLPRALSQRAWLRPEGEAP